MDNLRKMLSSSNLFEDTATPKEVGVRVSQFLLDLIEALHRDIDPLKSQVSRLADSMDQVLSDLSAIRDGRSTEAVATYRLQQVEHKLSRLEDELAAERKDTIRRARVREDEAKKQQNGMRFSIVLAGLGFLLGVLQWIITR